MSVVPRGRCGAGWAGLRPCRATGANTKGSWVSRRKGVRREALEPKYGCASSNCYTQETSTRLLFS